MDGTAQPALLLRDARRSARLTQTELARRSGTSQAAIARYEAGTTEPALSTLRRLVRVCGFDVGIELRDRSSTLDDVLSLADL